jgi:ABC-type maltose transport system permease subunit
VANLQGTVTLFALMFLGLMAPPALVLIPIYVGFARLHLLDTKWTLILPALASSFGVYMMRKFMRGQPRELEEAALIDGAGSSPSIGGSRYHSAAPRSPRSLSSPSPEQLHCAFRADQEP